MEHQVAASSVTPIARIKSATVAIAIVKNVTLPSNEQPFEIIGTGFCVHPAGAVVTCRHVAEAFMPKRLTELIAESKESKPGVKINIPTIQPFALFFRPEQETAQITVEAVGAQQVIVRGSDNIDVAMMRLSPAKPFKDGFPFVELDDPSSRIEDGSDVAVCGFPNGNLLMNTLGTVSSSFSRGIVSSVVPSAGVSLDRVRGYQLDLRATHGNSGGPLFCWDTGRVIGILQGGVDDIHGKHLFSYAGSIHRALAGDLIGQIFRVRNLRPFPDPPVAAREG